MSSVEILHIKDEVYVSIGKLILTFSQIEWLMSNAILFGKTLPHEYIKIKDLKITQEYFLVLLKLNFSRKIELLNKLGFNCETLRQIGDYRNTMTHGLLFRGTVKNLSKPESNAEQLDSSNIIANINLLEKEGGKLIDFITSKGHVLLSEVDKKII